MIRMSGTHFRSSSLVLLVSIITCMSTACYNTQGPVPENPHQPPARELLLQNVIVAEETICAPAPRDNGTPPPERDYIRYLRYRPQRRKNEVFEPLLKFMLENSRGRVIPR